MLDSVNIRASHWQQQICVPQKIHFAGWQAGHGDALKVGNPLSSKLDVELTPKHLWRVGLLLRAPAPEDSAPPCRAGTAMSRATNDEAYQIG